jgi:hypothetical protein
MSVRPRTTPAYPSTVERLLSLLPRLVAGVVAAAVAAWGIGMSWQFANGDSKSLLAALGMLLIATPLLTVLAAFVNHMLIDAVLTPVRWAVRRRAG